MENATQHKKACDLRATLDAAVCAASRDATAAALAAVDAEPELTDDMSDAMWEMIRNDRNAMTEALRIAVRQTKAAIRERLIECDAERQARAQQVALQTTPGVQSSSAAPDLIQEALDIAYDLVTAEAAHIHTVYKGYKPHKHARADADVETVRAAIALHEASELAPLETSLPILPRSGPR